MRVAANCGARLHLVEPLGFSLDEAAVRRGGLDYHELADVTRWPDLAACRAGIGNQRRWFATTASARRSYVDVDYRDDVIVFGCESDGLSPTDLATFPDDARLRIPMRPGNRSLNLANAVSVIAFEAWRQQGFEGASDAEGAGTVERFAP